MMKRPTSAELSAAPSLASFGHLLDKSFSEVKIERLGPPSGDGEIWLVLFEDGQRHWAELWDKPHQNRHPSMIAVIGPIRGVDMGGSNSLVS